MTIFDAIRWPVSVPPQPGELEALPRDLYENWYNNHTVDWYKHRGDNGETSPPQFVYDWMRDIFQSGAHYMDRFEQEITDDIDALRMLILEYNK